MNKHARFAAVCAAVLLACALLFSVCFVALETGHDCDGEHCAVCRQLQACQTLLERLPAASGAAFAAAALCAGRAARRTRRALPAVSPVAWRVKLLN